MKELSQNPVKGVVVWSCPSNIAIVKYWGKRPVQIPMNPSISMTLQNAQTTTRVEYNYTPERENPGIRFTFQGKKAPAFEQRIFAFINGLVSRMPLLTHTNLVVNSANTFPHSSGIASSASAYGALAMCLVELYENLAGPSGKADRLEIASSIARLGSGSASRSIYPGFALWGATGDWKGSSDEFAIPLTAYHEAFHGTRDSILIVESGQKLVASSMGHESMETNPFASVRFQQAHCNLSSLKQILSSGDWPGFIRVMEEEALSLHAMMMTGKPGFLLMKPGTIAILNRVRQFRKDTGVRAGFTLDAGANVHLLYAAGDEILVKNFIESDLIQFCENNQVIHDQMGKGPARIKS